MQFEVSTRVGARKHVFDGVHIAATWRKPLNRKVGRQERPCKKTCTNYPNRFFLEQIQQGTRQLANSASPGKWM